MGSTICVTGGAGFIGSHVADALVAAGHRVLIVDDLSSGRKENVPRDSELHVLDVRSEEAARLLVDRKVEVLVHHAAQMDVRRSVADPVFDAEVNLIGLLNLLEAARQASVRQVIFASTGGAIYGEQDNYPADEFHVARPLSLSVRLMGNMFADHAVVGTFAMLVPIIVPVPMMILGVLVCIVQTLVFCILSTVYIGLAVAHEEH